LGDGLPFSTEVDEKITVRDVLAIKRDYYEGTKFDLSKGVAGGPYGDPNRYDGSIDRPWNHNNLTIAEAQSGGFERAISLFRTSYSQVSVSKATTDENRLSRAIVYVAQFTPHMASYVPIFVAAGVDAVPARLSTGSLWRNDKESLFWKACAVGNYASHWFRYAIEDVRGVQKQLEDAIFNNLVRYFMSSYCVFTILSILLIFTHTG